MKKTLTKIRQVERQQQREKREERNQTISERRIDLNSEYISGRLFSKILKEWYAYKMVGQNTLHTSERKLLKEIISNLRMLSIDTNAVSKSD